MQKLGNVRLTSHLCPYFVTCQT